MGLLKNLFKGKAAPEDRLTDEDRRRMGERARRQDGAGEKPVSQMTEDEKLDYWWRVCELPDLNERLRHLEALAESGFDTAWLSMIEAYFAQSKAQGTELPFEKMEYCARKAADADLPEGHKHLGMILGSPLYGELDTEGAAREYLLAIEGGSESAAEFLLDYWNREFHLEQYTPEENRQLTAGFHEIIREAIRPEIERLSGESGSKKALTAFGLLYFYGIYFEQSLDKAREYFMRLDEMGSSLAHRMLANPVFEFEEDEDDEDE